MTAFKLRHFGLCLNTYVLESHLIKGVQARTVRKAEAKISKRMPHLHDFTHLVETTFHSVSSLVIASKFILKAWYITLAKAFKSSQKKKDGDLKYIQIINNYSTKSNMLFDLLMKNSWVLPLLI